MFWFGFLGFLSVTGIAVGSNPESLNIYDSLSLFDCRPGKGETEAEWELGRPFLCVTAKVRGEGIVTEGGFEGYQKGLFSELHGSYVYNSILGLHSSVRAESIWSAAQPQADDYATDLALVQFGNLAYSQLRLVFGRGRLPQGVNRPVIKGWYDKQSRNDFFNNPKYVIYGTYDSREQISIDWGLAVESRSSQNNTDCGETEKCAANKAAVLRFVYDFAVLGSTRSVVTLYGEQLGRRRGGLGLLTVGPNKDETHLEIMREISSPDGKIDQFSQLIRFGYLGPIQGSTRWSFQMDDELKQVTRAVLFYEQHLWEFIWLSQGVGYSKGKKIKNRNGWTYHIGLGTSL